MRTRKVKWKKIRRGLTYRLVVSLLWVLSRIPFNLRIRLIGLLAVLTYYLIPRERRRILANLEAAYGDELSPRARRRIARSVFRNLGYSACEVLQIPEGKPFWDRLRIEISGEQYIERALKKGKGVVFVSAHAGNWELSGGWMARNGLGAGVVARRTREERFEPIIRRYRAAAGMQVHLKSLSMLGMVRSLRKNQTVVIMGDLDTKGEGVFAPFFGRPAYTQTGPARLAQRTGAPILTGFTARTGRLAHTIEIGPPIEVANLGNDKDNWDQIRSAVNEYTRRIEAWIRDHPDQWIWMHRRWKTRPPKPEGGK